MFDGVPEQFHQFIASPRTTSVPLPPLTFPIHHGSSTAQTFPSFDPFPSSYHHHHHSVVLPELHLQAPPTQKEQVKEAQQQSTLLLPSLDVEQLQRSSERSDPEPIVPWSNDEVLSLLRIRSSMENWFPDFTWEYVSRKLAEAGFKRSAEKCKEKFEEESRHLNTMNFTRSYRFFSELEELCHGEKNPDQVLAEKNQNIEQLPKEFEEDPRNETVEEKSSNPSQENENKSKDKERKRKRHHRFQKLKGVCEEIVRKLMAQQEELHNKLIEDMVKRDEEKIAREEAWKRQEMERIDKEIEIRAHEQAIAGDRQTKLIEFLKNFTSNPSENESDSPLVRQSQNPNPICQLPSDQNKAESVNSPPQPRNPKTPTLSTKTSPPPPQNPSSTLPTTRRKVPISTPYSQNTPTTQINPFTLTPSSAQKAPKNPNLGESEREDIITGKRWPRDEVLALINLRCSSSVNGGPDQEKGGGGGGGGGKGPPLWERISQGMLELGYKRSAKRCKEKWENINKYFRKTKDVNKKRSLDSRTCPYFQQLSSLYSRGNLPAAPPAIGPPENNPAPAENHLELPAGGGDGVAN